MCFYLSVYKFSVCVSVYLSVCVSVCLSVCLSAIDNGKNMTFMILYYCKWGKARCKSTLVIDQYIFDCFLVAKLLLNSKRFEGNVIFGEYSY